MTDFNDRATLIEKKLFPHKKVALGDLRQIDGPLFDLNGLDLVFEPSVLNTLNRQIGTNRSQLDIVRNASGDMVPFASFGSVEEVMGQPTVSRYNMYTTASVTASLNQHVSSSAGIKAMEEIMEQTVGPQFGYAWTGEALQETQSGTTITMTLLFAVIITILVLAAQYESWTDPVAVVATTPTAVLGAILGCIFLSQSVSIYTQIGIILLLGMAAKNAILIVEYAMDYRKAGESIHDAASSAGNVRLRPILMTALAFVFGVMPMLFATGAGAASRLSLGTAVVFGMAVNALLGTLFVPSIWELLQRFREKYLSKVFK